MQVNEQEHRCLAIDVLCQFQVAANAEVNFVLPINLQAMSIYHNLNKGNAPSTTDVGAQEAIGYGDDVDSSLDEDNYESEEANEDEDVTVEGNPDRTKT